MTSYHQDMLYILNNNPWITEGGKGSFFDFDLLFCCALSLSELNALFAIISKIIKSNRTVQSLIRIETLILSLIISAILKNIYIFKHKATVFDEDISAFEDSANIAKRKNNATLFQWKCLAYCLKY